MEPLFYEKSDSFNNIPLYLNEQNAKHCIQVLRKKINDIIYLTDGNGLLYDCIIEQINHKKQVLVSITTKKIIEKPVQEIYVAVSPLHNANRFEILIEKITEIGVYQIIPMSCNRTIFPKYKRARIQTIIESAMIQSQQCYLPILRDLMPFEQVIKEFNFIQQKLIAHCNINEKIDYKSINPSNQILIMIGPEGDFTNLEIETAMKNGFSCISLGKNRLRTETACIFIVSNLKN